MMPTAEEVFMQSTVITMAGNKQKVMSLMIEFAKIHVKEALKQASVKGETKKYNYGPGGSHIGIERNSILNAYPLENIK